MIKTHNIQHIHTDHSNGTTNIDSVTKFRQYVDRAVDEGMTSIAFTEHGNLFSWYEKKKYCESKGIKYIHGVEMYFTDTLEEKVRDNYHVCMYAKNFDGFKELNKLVSKASDRSDGHFYYVPRITFDELANTSDNIIIATACMSGGLRPNSKVKRKYIDFLAKNKHRCFIEVQPHLVDAQSRYNREIADIANEYQIPLIAGTDTHALNETHAKGRKLLQRSKGVFFADEEGWDITWKTLPELVECFEKQQSLSANEYMSAILNTHVLPNMVEDFEIDTSYKYPKLYANPEEVLFEKIKKGISDRGVDKYENYQEYLDRINHEMKAYRHNKAVDYLLLDEGLKTDAKSAGIFPGPSRGSVSGSIIAYLIGMTDMDSIKRKLNFERFMNTARVSLADVDSDWPPSRREEVKNILYSKPGLYCSEIITFNTTKLKGSIRDVCRALYKKEPSKELREQADRDVEGYGQLTGWTSKEFEKLDKTYIEISNYICLNVEDNEEQMRREYPEVFEYVDIINGTIVSVGIHPCGTIVSPIPLDENVGLTSVKTCDKPVSMLNMNEINDLFFVKLDILGLENVELINDTCTLAGIPRITPDNVDPNDERVWKAIRDNTLGIFQWNGETGSRYIKHLFADETIEKIKAGYKKLGIKFSYMDLFSVGNGAIRPGGASYRDALSEGLFYDNGHEGINKFLAPTLGYLVYQEQIMDFLVEFCGYEKGEADIVRRAVAKKKNSEQYLPEIKRRFIAYMQKTENMEYEKAEKIIEVFLQVILDSSDYLFSLNHSDAYSWIGYMCGWLREYYPFEFLTVMLNHSSGDLEKTKEIIDYAKTRGINISPPTFGKSRGDYFFDKNTNSIYKGIASVKYMNNEVADTFYKLYKEKEFNNFTEVLLHIKENKLATSKHIEVLIKINYFRQFGTVKKLLKVKELFDRFTARKQFKREDFNNLQIEMLEKYSSSSTEKIIKGLDVKGLVSELESMIKDVELPPGNIIGFQNELMGSIDFISELHDENTFVVIKVDTKYSPVLTIYRPKDGLIQEVKVDKQFFNEKPLQLYDTIYVSSVNAKKRRRKIDGKWMITDEVVLFISYYLLSRV